MRRPPRLTAWRLTIPALLLATLAVPSAAATAATAATASGHRHPLWLVKSNDLALLREQAAKDGRTLRRFNWVGCGGKSDPDVCRPGQDPIYTNYWSLRARARANWAGTVIFDIESWRDTPADQREHPRYWICRAARLRRIDRRLRVIITPWSRPAKLIGEDVAAAKCGAYAVDIQTQFINGRPEKLARFIRGAVRAIRKANKRIIILAGLATNNPHPESAGVLATDYRVAQANGVQGFWLNANDWKGQNRCKAAKGGAGCPQVGVRFLADIGMTRIRPRPPALPVSPNAGLGPGLMLLTAVPPW